MKQVFAGVFAPQRRLLTTLLDPVSATPESLLPAPRHDTRTAPSSSLSHTSRISLQALPTAISPDTVVPVSSPSNAPTLSPAFSPSVAPPTFQDGPAPYGPSNATAPSPNPAGTSFSLRRSFTSLSHYDVRLFSSANLVCMELPHRSSSFSALLCRAFSFGNELSLKVYYCHSRIYSPVLARIVELYRAVDGLRGLKFLDHSCI